jgi:ankyrin repeat protein
MDQRQFIKLCGMGDLYGARRILNNCEKKRKPLDISNNNDEAFHTACNNGRLEIVEWLLQLYEEKQIHIDIVNYKEIYKIFRNACEKGHLRFAQWLLQLKPDMSIYSRCVFTNVCSNGHLEVAKWLLQVLNKIARTTDLSMPFYNTCLNGHLHVAQWLLQVSRERGQTSIVLSYDDVFYHVCLGLGSRLEVAKWLLQVADEIGKPINISGHDAVVFRYACTRGDLKFAKWLLHVANEMGQPINISANDDEAFLQSCSYGHHSYCHGYGHHSYHNGYSEVAKWLQSLKPYLYMIQYSKDGRINSWRIMSKEESNWQRRKYLAWLASEHCPEQNKTNIFYKLPSDVSRLLIGFV